MRFQLAMLLILTGAPACRPPEPQEEPVAEANSWEVSKGGRLVLTVTDVPGPVVSSAVRPPGGEPVRHPFLSASAHAPDEEDALRRLLEESNSTRDFLERLKKAGYAVAPR